MNRFTIIRSGEKLPSDIKPASEQQLQQPERFQTEVYKAIEILGRKLERSEAERERLAARLAQIEAATTLDKETGKFSLPAIIERASTPDAAAGPIPRSAFIMMSVSIFAAFFALGIELMQPPQKPVQLGTVLSADQIAALDALTVQHMSGLLANNSVKPNEWQNVEALAEENNKSLPGEPQIAEKVVSTPIMPESEAALASLSEKIEKSEAKAETSAYTTIDRDEALPKKFLRLQDRAYKGVGEAQHDLAAIYASGKDVPQDYKRAAYWFARAADSGIANAHYNLGVMFQQGLGVREDLKKAIGWYKSAAELGHPEAMYNLGIAYTDGVGLTQNAERGASYFKRAAQAGISQAAYNLGVLYESGFLGGKVDTKQAIHWYSEASKKGQVEAKQALERLKKA